MVSVAIVIGVSPISTPPNTEAPATPAESDTPTVWVTIAVPRIVVSVVPITRVIVCTKVDVGPAVVVERVTARLGHHFAHTVLGHVVVEVRTRSHSGGDVRQVGLGIVEYEPRIGQAIVPVLVACEFVEAKRIARECGVYRTDTALSEDAEGFTIAPTPDLEFATALHEVVLDRIDREQDAHAAIRLGMQHEQIPVRCDARIDSDTVAQPHLTPIEPDLHRKIGLLRENCGRGGFSSACCRDQEREECDAQHNYLRGADG